ncbi:MAG: hypothetical protein K0R24_1656 [Gammaproteobacteria bacterium]|nr:hypothetical protein [Gammaproteobacteria bacterium]
MNYGIAGTGHHYTLVSRSNRASNQAKLMLSQHSGIIVSGEARGITTACLLAWAVKGKARFVLLGRTILDSSLDSYNEQIMPTSLLLSKA